MAEATGGSGKRVSAPLVLAAASAMLATAGVVYFSTQGDGAVAPELPQQSEADSFHIDDSSPERVAESFYDAWRRRRWAQALEISVGEARDAVRTKRAGDEALPREERIVAERTWDALAHAPLTMLLDEAEMLGGDRYRLHGTAEYQFVGRPYRRRVEFLIEPAGERYRVAEMNLGEVLTELPELFQGAAPEAR